MKALKFLALIIFSTSAHAGGFKCVNGPVERLVTLDYPGQQHLCEVAVTDENGSRDIKWFANNDSGFCTDKIEELVGKYRNQWGYTCEIVTYTTNLEVLPARYRKLVDDIVRDASAEGKTAEIPFTVSATRVRTTQLEASSANALVIQLFMNALDESITTPVDRTYFIEDDGTQIRTKSVWSGMRDKVTLEGDSYRVDTAIINEINPNGEIEIETILHSANSTDDNNQNCRGTQLLQTTDAGDLTPVGKHKISCN